MNKYIRHPEKEDPTQEYLLKQLELELNKITQISKGDDFLAQLKEIYVSLESIDEEEDPSLFAMTGGYVKEFVTTFLILYFGTNDIHKSLEAHSLIKSLTKYIVLLDKHYDEKNYEYKVRADAIFKGVMMHVDGYMQQAIIHNMASLWATATYEIKLRGRMLKEDEIFERKEIRYHIFQKSSDTVLYSVIMDNYIPSFNANVMQLLHYNQAVLDIQDDLNDLAEDLLRHDLNIFTMAARKDMEIAEMFSHRTSPKKIVQCASDTVCAIVDDFEDCIEGLTVPKQFSFMKILSRDYISKVRQNIKSAQA